MLLFDQNISFRIVKLLRTSFPGCAHVSDRKLKGAPDRSIWKFAETTGSCIVTFDRDFEDLAALKGPPPKVVLLCTGNTGTLELAHLLRKHEASIKHFLHDQEMRSVSVLRIG
ncbi:MAG: DUF5615 family PIN-like protein [Flavobacteriales bacterium]|nr:MAG: DUF5615 family PIN-like protein [Flavobacteriales bacterium]